MRNLFFAGVVTFMIVTGFCAIVFGVANYYEPKDKDLWCERNMPVYNISRNIKVQYCYGEGWDKYCQISYPTYCPTHKHEDR